LREIRDFSPVKAELNVENSRRKAALAVQMGLAGLVTGSFFELK